MAHSVLYRLSLVAITMVVGGLLSASLVRYAPGFGVDERLLDARLSSDSIQAIRDDHRGDQRIFEFYAGYLQRALHGDFGTSRSLDRPVRQLLAERWSVTGKLVAKGLGVAWFAALALVFVTSLSRLPALTLLATLFTGGLLCLPAAVLALLSIILAAPAYLALALVLFPKIYRYLSSLAATLRARPHLIAAEAGGICRTRIFFFQIVPVIQRELLALAGVSVSLAISAAIPIEALFGIPGVGQLAWHSALARDLPLLLTLSTLVIACVTVANSGADFLPVPRRSA